MESEQTDVIQIDRISLNEEGEILSDEDDILLPNNSSNKDKKQELIKEKLHLNSNNDLEEGELSDEPDNSNKIISKYSINKVKIVDSSTLGPTCRIPCRFFTRGINCNWGMTCRFLHPGVNDAHLKFASPLTGNPVQMPSPQINIVLPKIENAMEEFPEEKKPEVLLPSSQESAWERGLKQAKRLLKRNNSGLSSSTKAGKDQEDDISNKNIKAGLFGPDADVETNKEDCTEKIDPNIETPVRNNLSVTVIVNDKTCTDGGDLSLSSKTGDEIKKKKTTISAPSPPLGFESEDSVSCSTNRSSHSFGPPHHSGGAAPPSLMRPGGVLGPLPPGIHQHHHHHPHLPLPPPPHHHHPYRYSHPPPLPMIRGPPHALYPPLRGGPRPLLPLPPPPYGMHHPPPPYYHEYYDETHGVSPYYDSPRFARALPLPHSSSLPMRYRYPCPGAAGPRGLPGRYYPHPPPPPPPGAFGMPPGGGGEYPYPYSYHYDYEEEGESDVAYEKGLISDLRETLTLKRHRKSDISLGASATENAQDSNNGDIQVQRRTSTNYNTEKEYGKNSRSEKLDRFVDNDRRSFEGAGGGEGLRSSYRSSYSRVHREGSIDRLYGPSRGQRYNNMTSSGNGAAHYSSTDRHHENRYFKSQQQQHWEHGNNYRGEAKKRMERTGNRSGTPSSDSYNYLSKRCKRIEDDWNDPWLRRRRPLRDQQDSNSPTPERSSYKTEDKFKSRASKSRLLPHIEDEDDHSSISSVSSLTAAPTTSQNPDNKHLSSDNETTTTSSIAGGMPSITSVKSVKTPVNSAFSGPVSLTEAAAHPDDRSSAMSSNSSTSISSASSLSGKRKIQTNHEKTTTDNTKQQRSSSSDSSSSTSSSPSSTSSHRNYKRIQKQPVPSQVYQRPIVIEHNLKRKERSDSFSSISSAESTTKNSSSQKSTTVKPISTTLPPENVITKNDDDSSNQREENHPPLKITIKTKDNVTMVVQNRNANNNEKENVQTKNNSFEAFSPVSSSSSSSSSSPTRSEISPDERKSSPLSAAPKLKSNFVKAEVLPTITTATTTQNNNLTATLLPNVSNKQMGGPISIITTKVVKPSPKLKIPVNKSGSFNSSTTANVTKTADVTSKSNVTTLSPLNKVNALPLNNKNIPGANEAPKQNTIRGNNSVNAVIISSNAGTAATTITTSINNKELKDKRREYLLKQLKAVEEAIERKRTK